MLVTISMVALMRRLLGVNVCSSAYEAEPEGTPLATVLHIATEARAVAFVHCGPHMAGTDSCAPAPYRLTVLPSHRLHLTVFCGGGGLGGAPAGRGCRSKTRMATPSAPPSGTATSTAKSTVKDKFAGRGLKKERGLIECFEFALQPWRIV